MNKNINLLPCPFCGGTPYIEEIPAHKHALGGCIPDSEGEAFIMCNCSAAISGKTKEDVASKWNSRKEMPR
jgi:hypothetical protein